MSSDATRVRSFEGMLAVPVACSCVAHTEASARREADSRTVSLAAEFSIPRAHAFRRAHRPMSGEPHELQQKQKQGSSEMTTGSVLMNVFLDAGISAVVAGVALLMAWRDQLRLR